MGPEEVEANAGALALQLLAWYVSGEREAGRDSGLLRARVVGDNVQVVRYCASQCRLRSFASREPVDAAWCSAVAQGWALDWRLVRRQLNVHAHELSRAAAGWAASRQMAGEAGSRIIYSVPLSGGPDVPGLFLLAWPD